MCWLILNQATDMSVSLLVVERRSRFSISQGSFDCFDGETCVLLSSEQEFCIVVTDG